MLDVTPGEHIQIKQILSDNLPEGTKAYAFGSRTQNKARRFSDLDVVLIGEEDIPFSLMAELQDVFSESDLPYRVDIIDWARISDEFRQAIQEQLRAL